MTAKAQTTRHRILSIDSRPDYQMIVLDTPGIMKVKQLLQLLLCICELHHLQVYFRTRALQAV